jgi:hypothetical protein
MHRRWRRLVLELRVALSVVERCHPVLELGLDGDDRERRRRNVGDDALLRRNRVGCQLRRLVGRQPFLHARAPDEDVRRERAARERRSKLVGMNHALYALRICPAPLFAAAGHRHLAGQG